MIGRAASDRGELVERSRSHGDSMCKLKIFAGFPAAKIRLSEGVGKGQFSHLGFPFSDAHDRELRSGGSQAKSPLGRRGGSSLEWCSQGGIRGCGGCWPV